MRVCVPNWSKVIKLVIRLVLTTKNVIHSIAVENRRNCSVVSCFCAQFVRIFPLKVDRFYLIDRFELASWVHVGRFVGVTKINDFCAFSCALVHFRCTKSDFCFNRSQTVIGHINLFDITWLVTLLIAVIWSSRFQRDTFIRFFHIFPWNSMRC